MSQRKRVLFVATVVKTHIMEFHLPYLKMFKEMGWETVVAARNDFENKSDCIIPYCDEYYDIHFERNPLKFKNIKAYKNLKAIINDGGYNIIHCHTPVGAMLTRLAGKKARKSGTKIIYTAHGFHFYKGAPVINWLIYYPVEKWLAHYTDVLITINKEDYERAKSFKAGKVVYVPGVGIDLNKFNKDKSYASTDLLKEHGIRKEFGIPSDAKVILSVGEVNKNKNHVLGIEALAKLKNKNVFYVICGRGPLINDYKLLAHKLGVSERVIFAGYRTDVIDFYYEADVFLFPSLREGLSVAVMEAMAMGVPVICNAIRGNTDLIDDKVSGLLINNQIDELVKAVQELIYNDELRDKIICAERKKVERFGFKNVSEMMRKVYEQG